jgi:Ca2+/Na+ antiporter
MDRPLTIEHGSNRFGRAMRENRLKIALLVALAEGVLVLVGKIDWWVVAILAVVAVVVYVSRGREARREEVREGTWILAVSQLAVVLVPVLALVLTAFAVVLLVFFAIVALVVLLRDRR